MGLFIKKPLADLMTEANDSGSKSLKRILGPWSLIALGVGVIIGAGLLIASTVETIMSTASDGKLSLQNGLRRRQKQPAEMSRQLQFAE